jgi:hypothetical protein
VCPQAAQLSTKSYWPNSSLSFSTLKSRRIGGFCES